MAGPGPKSPMSRDEVDSILVALVAAHDRISAAMFTIDGHPGLVVLRGASLTGESRRTAQRVLPGVDLLWSHYTAFGVQLERAREIRAGRSRPGENELRALTALLRSPSVGLTADGMAFDASAESGPVRRICLGDLVTGLEQHGTEILAQLGDVAAACSWVAGQFAPIAEALARVRSAATELGDDALPGGALDRLAEGIHTAQAESLDDPLGAVGGGPPEAALAGRSRVLAGEVDELAARVAELTALRDDYPRRVGVLRAQIEVVALAEAEVGRSYTVCLEKIADPHLPAAPDEAPRLRTHLAQLDQIFRERRWQRLRDECAAIERTTGSAAERAAHLREAADGLLRRRAELRGRLDAYRAKAGRLGLVEHAELATRHRMARDLLYTSPCDLPAATRAVVAYQRYLNDLTERVTPGDKEAPA
jgi:hypothetical protein